MLSPVVCRVLVGVYNPLISLVAMMVLPMETLYEHPSDMLAVMADTIGGSNFRWIVCFDAVIVLCGAVLTSIVGVSALMCRLSADSVLPAFLGRMNSRQAPYISILVFVALSMSLFVAIYDPTSDSAINDFGGVYAIAFLSVLSAFAISTIILKLHRAQIARRMIARWWEITVSLFAVTVGLIGNIVLTPEVFTLFLAYLSGFLAVVIYMFSRVELLTFGIWMVGRVLRFPFECADVSTLWYQMRKLYLNPGKRLQASLDEQAVLDAAKLQDDYDEYLQLDPRRSVDNNNNTVVNTMAADTLANAASEANKGNQADSFSYRYSNGNRNIEDWGTVLQEAVRRRLGTNLDNSTELSVTVANTNPTDVRTDKTAAYEIERVLSVPCMKPFMEYMVRSLDKIVSTPFVYLAKGSNPTAVQQAVQYISNNELTSNIIVLHFVDDRKSARLHTTMIRKLSKVVERGDMDMEAADRISYNVIRQSYTAPSPSPSMNNLSDFNGEGGEPDTTMQTFLLDSNREPSATGLDGVFDLEDSLPALSDNVKQLIKAVSLLDTFYS
jgi:hypothetical protein